MPKDLSPEEKLLRLIRSKAPQSPGAVLMPKYSGPDTPAKPVTSSKEIPAAPAKPIPRRSTPPQKTVKILSMESLNLILILLLAGLLIYFIPLFFKTRKPVVEGLEDKVMAREKQLARKEEEPKKQPFNYFSEPVVSKNIFAPAIKEDSQAPAAAQEEGPKLEDVKAQLNLLGIIGGDNPQAIIEDKKTQKTHFLNKGQSFDNIEVKDISENKVTLIYKNQQFELVI